MNLKCQKCGCVVWRTGAGLYDPCRESMLSGLTPEDLNEVDPGCWAELPHVTSSLCGGEMLEVRRRDQENSRTEKKA